MDAKLMTIMLSFSYIEEMTKLSGALNSPRWQLKTILHLTDEIRILFIGREIYTFVTDDKYGKYFSNMGNNDITYPLAYGEKNVTALSFHDFIPRFEIEDESIRKRVVEKDTSFNHIDIFWILTLHLRMKITSQNQF